MNIVFYYDLFSINCSKLPCVILCTFVMFRIIWIFESLLLTNDKRGKSSSKEPQVRAEPWAESLYMRCILYKMS